MKSKVMLKDREELIRINKAMTPQQRLNAFLQHSMLLSQLSSKNNTSKTPKRTSTRKK